MARRHIVTRSGARRETLWFFTSIVRATLTANGGTLLTSLNAAALALRPFTIVRTHQTIHIKSDQVAASEVQIGAWAALVVSEAASAAGVASVPTPISEGDSDLFFAYQAMVNEFTLATAVGIDADAGTQYVLDSKAMRRVNGDQDVITVAEVDASTGDGMVITTFGRMLVKLH